MIQEPILITVILAAVVTSAARWHEHFKNSKVMRFLPTPVLCYIPPTILTTVGILPMQSVVYDWISRYVLPACLILLLMTTDIKGLKKMGRIALIAMLGATGTVIIGGISVFFLFRNQLGPENWKAIGTLTASWVGGTANQLAVKQATNLSDALFGPLFISDITMVYIWMTFLMILSVNQKKIDCFFQADRKQIEIITSHSSALQNPLPTSPRKIFTRSLITCLFAGFALGGISTWMGSQIPEIGMAINRSTWIIILVTTIGLMMAFTRFAHRESATSAHVGYFLLYFVLASTGAKANLLAIVKAPLFLGIAFIWMIIHGVLFLIFGRFLRIPIAMLATASQAALGGVVSAPIVASTYEPKLISIALILAIFGNAIGNYIGILTAQFLRLFSG